VFSRQQGIPFLSPHAVLVCILEASPRGTGWAYTLAAAGSASSPRSRRIGRLYALHCELFDAVQNVVTAAGIRLFIKSPFHLITLREAVILS
jgi:hypothetical protein